MTAAADYSFNKSHAACYALISYRTAYLKANYPAEYMAAVISSVMSTKDKVPFFVNKCDGDGHRGAAARRQLVRPRLRGQRQVDPLRARRGQERRPPGGRDDHRRARGRGRSSRSGTSASASTRAAVNKRAIECLIKCGALDSTGDPRRGMLEVLASGAVGGPEGAGGLAPRPGLDLRPRRGRPAAEPPTPRIRRAAAIRRCPAEEFDQRELLRLEKETLGTFVSAHPLGEVRDALRAAVDRPLADVPPMPDGAWVTVGGIVCGGEEGAHAARRLRDVRRPSTTSRGGSSCSSATPPRSRPR